MNQTAASREMSGQLLCFAIIHALTKACALKNQSLRAKHRIRFVVSLSTNLTDSACSVLAYNTATNYVPHLHLQAHYDHEIAHICMSLEANIKHKERKLSIKVVYNNSI